MWRCLKTPASRSFAQPFVQVLIKENIKAPWHWTLWGESPETGGFPLQRASNAENGSVWRRHHGWTLKVPGTKNGRYYASRCLRIQRCQDTTDEKLTTEIKYVTSHLPPCSLMLSHTISRNQPELLKVALQPSHYLNQCWNIVNLNVENMYSAFYKILLIETGCATWGTRRR